MVCCTCKEEKLAGLFVKNSLRCLACNAKLGREWRANNKQRAKELKALDLARLRERVLTQYHNKCNTCGYNNPRALQVDHLQGGGLTEKRLIGTVGIYRRTLRHPNEYQLLCANCNILKLYALKEHLCRYK